MRLILTLNKIYENQFKKRKQFLFLITTIILFSCSEEIYNHEHTTIESNIKKEKINFEKFKKNEKAFEVYSKLKATINNKTEKAIGVNDLDFEVIFDNGILLNYADLESYTFPIRRLIPNGLLENLVINKHSDGKYYAKILKYNLTIQEKLDLKNSALKSIQNPIQTVVLGEFSFGNTIQSDLCYQTVQVITSCGSGEHHAGNIADWASCKATTLPSIRTVTIAADCGSSTGGGGFNYGYGDGTSGFFGNPFTGIGGNGGGFITPTFPNSSTPSDLYENGISEPVLDISTGDAVHPVIAFFSNLNDQQSLWLSQQSNTTIQSMIDYLNANNCSMENKDKIESLINVAIATGTTFTIDPTITSSNAQVFNNSDDMNTFLTEYFNNNLANDDGLITDPLQQNTKVARCSFQPDSWFPYYINVQIKQKPATSTTTYELISVTSNQSGATLASEWHQNNDEEITFNNNVVEIVFTGTMGINCFIDGIGVLYTDNVTIKIKLNKLTGGFISGSMYGID